MARATPKTAARAATVWPFTMTANVWYRSLSYDISKSEEWDTWTRAQRTAYILDLLQTYVQEAAFAKQSTIRAGADNIVFSQPYMTDAIAFLEAAPQNLHVRTVVNAQDGRDYVEISCVPFPV